MPTGSCQPCGKYWVADYAYTAKCAAGGTGNPVTVTRQGRSTISYEDARLVARRLAKAEAEAELACTWISEQCAPVTCGMYPPICRTAESSVSQADADAKALAEAVEAAAEFCA